MCFESNMRNFASTLVKFSKLSHIPTTIWRPPKMAPPALRGQRGPLLRHWPMPAIFALSRAQLLLLVVTRSRDLSRECHVTKHKTPARSNFPLSNFENSGTIQFSSSSSTSRGLCPKNYEKRAHPNIIHLWIRIN